MKKSFLYIIIFALVLLSIAGCGEEKQVEIVRVPLPVEDRLAMIDAAFEAEDYAAVREIYRAAQGEDYAEIEDHIIGYTLLYIDQAKQQLSTKDLEEFKNTGYEGSVLTDGIALVERLIISEAAYTEGKIAFNGRDFETAKEKLAVVDPEYSDYETAQECLASIADREQAWETSTYGRNQGTYALAKDDEFTYMAYETGGITGILKVDLAGEYTEFIPMSDAGDYIITGINIVGDYLYFIAGENVGRGLMIENPYCIYEMKTDGSGLAQVAGGDYFDMTIRGSKVYALSYTKGLVKFDNTFAEESVVAEGRVIEFSVAPEGVYYTVRSSLNKDNVNTVYLFDGENTEEIMSGSFAHYYIYDQNALSLTSTGDVKEELILQTRGEEKKITSADILKVYGLIGDRVIYSTSGGEAQERLRDYDITTGDDEVYMDSNDLPEYYITGMCYQTEQIFAVNPEGIFITKPGFEEYTQLEIAEADEEVLANNKALLRHIGDAELYSPEEETIVVLSDELLWYYSDSALCVIMEKRFLEESEVTAYITHIYTTDFDSLTTGSWGDSPDSRTTAKPEEIAEKYGIIYGQSADFFNYNSDTRRGIVIRHGEIYRDRLYNSMVAIYPDGTLATYEKGDTISAERLVEDGVKTSLSFGPVLVENGFLSPSSPDSKVAVRNPRSAIGMVEPGHYVSIVVDGRNTNSRGLTTVALGELFADEGCKTAYNLDGGGTVSVTFLGNMMDMYSHYRNLPDMLYFGSSDLVPLSLDEYTTTFEEYTTAETQVEE